jgi:hypothetical protein
MLPRRLTIPRSWRALLLFVLAMLPLVAGVFLVASDFFSGWNGQVVSFRPTRDADPAVLGVLIVDDDGTRRERNWDAALVRELSLPADPLALPPPDIPAERPHTSKLRFTFHFLVDVGSGEAVETRVVPTTSPRGLGLALAFLILAVGVRNMMYAGSPFALERRGAFLPKQQAQAGAPAPPASPGRTRGRKGPPPSGRRRGRGRR